MWENGNGGVSTRACRRAKLTSIRAPRAGFKTRKEMLELARTKTLDKVEERETLEVAFCKRAGARDERDRWDDWVPGTWYFVVCTP
jgi:hypothetical protein